MKTDLIDICLLKPTEKTDHENYIKIEKLFANLEIDWPAIFVSEDFFILDGHHRFRLACEIGLLKIKCIVVDYFSDDVNVEDFKTGQPLDKHQLMVQYRAGGLLPPKSTRHYFDFNTVG